MTSRTGGGRGDVVKRTATSSRGVAAAAEGGRSAVNTTRATPSSQVDRRTGKKRGGHAWLGTCPSAVTTPPPAALAAEACARSLHTPRHRRAGGPQGEYRPTPTRRPGKLAGRGCARRPAASPRRGGGESPPRLPHPAKRPVVTGGRVDRLGAGRSSKVAGSVHTQPERMGRRGSPELKRLPSASRHAMVMTMKPSAKLRTMFLVSTV